jgi:succinate dehydrogenase/fumarate reductase flavoprotein subunit
MGAEGFAEEVDLLVIGAGAAGMTAALVGALEGLRVLLCEKGAQLGGTTATSAGTIWVPGSSQSRRDGVPDDAADAARFLDSVIGLRPGGAERAAFLEAGAKALDDLEARSEVRFAAAKVHPDYLANHPGAAIGGRALSPLPFDGRRLGADFALVRPPRAEFLVLGGMMVQRGEIPALLKPFASVAHFRQAASLLLRHGLDRLRHPRGTRLVMGNALVARLLFSLRRQGVPIHTRTSLMELLREGGRVTGAVLATPDGPRRIAARRGVVLATGGLGWNAALRERLLPEAARAVSLAPETNTGDGVALALRAGAALDEAHETAAYWMPVSVLRRPDGSVSVWPHIILDRSKPGLIAVNSAGRRFVNESDSYHDFVMGMFRAHRSVPSIPAHLICDRGFIRDYGIGLVRPGTRDLRPFLDAGYLTEGATLEDLAARIGVDAAGLARSVADHNRYAATGIDEEFGRGSTPLNRVNGDASNLPNPCMRPIGPGPFYAVQVAPADLAAAAGLRADADGRVLDADDAAIPGLYACGNDMSSVMRGLYPGPGTTIGPAIVFAWRVAMHAAGRAA